MSEELVWTREKAACIDWTDPTEVLASRFTFLDMVSLHPALAEYYYHPRLSQDSRTTTSACSSRSDGNSDTLPDENQAEGLRTQNEESILAERKKLRELFLHHSSLAEAKEEAEEEEAALQKLPKILKILKGGKENGMEEQHVLALTSCIGGRHSKVAEKIKILMTWVQKGLFTLRTARWCRQCGAEGHTVKMCPYLHLNLKGGERDTIRRSSLLLVRDRVSHADSVTMKEDKEKEEEKDEEVDNNRELHERTAGSALLSSVPLLISSPTSSLSVLEKYRAHQVRLEKKRFLEEKAARMDQLKQGLPCRNSNMSSTGAPTSGTAMVVSPNRARHEPSSLTHPSNIQESMGKQALMGRGGVPQTWQKNTRELELFSDERCRGVVEKLDPSHNIGFVRTIGNAGGSSLCGSGTAGGEDYKFFIDRSDCGVKPLEIGTRVTFKIDKGREFPMGVDVRAEFPVINAEDVKVLLRRCRLAGVGGTHTIEILAMLVSHVSEWQDVLRHFYSSWVEWKAHRGQGPLPGRQECGESAIRSPSISSSSVGSSSLSAKGSSMPSAPSPFPDSEKRMAMDTLPLWISQVQAIVELITFYTNREPIHHPILVAFLLLLVSPISVSPTGSHAAPVDWRNTGNPASSSSSLASRHVSPTSSTSFSFLKDLFASFVAFWQDEIAASCLFSSSTPSPLPIEEGIVADGAVVLPSPREQNHSADEEKKENWVTAVADTLCESADLIVLVHQNTTERKESNHYLHNLCAGLKDTLHALWKYTTARATMNLRRSAAQIELMARASRRLHSGFERLKKISSSFQDATPLAHRGSSPFPLSSTSSFPTLSIFPTAEELAIPPPYEDSVFHPSHLPVCFMAAPTSCRPNARSPPSMDPRPEEERSSGEEKSMGPSSPYDTTENFILSHCQLLRADTFESTARLLSATCFDSKNYPPSEETVSDAAHAAVYDHVRFMGRVLPRDHDYAHPTGYLFQVRPRSAQASLAARLQQGTCVCFVTALSTEWVTTITTATLTDSPSSSSPSVPLTDSFPVSSDEIFWGTISSCDAVLLEAGIICVEPCVTGSSDLAPPPPFSQLVANLSRNAAQNRLDRCLMLETSIFYAGYSSIMNSLKAFLGPFAMPLPQSKRLRGPGRENTDPLSSTSSFSSSQRRLLPYIPVQCCQAFLRIIGSVRKSFPLDKGQEKVMLSLPYESILLVQGPPGTGKSFIGCRVVETYVRYKQMVESGDMLQHLSIADLKDDRMREKNTSPTGPPSSSPGDLGSGTAREKDDPLPTSLSPVVVITYKNHALDEFLVDLLNSHLWNADEAASSEIPSRTVSSGAHIFPGGARLIRIGGRSKETRLAPYNLSSLMRESENKSIITRYREHIGILHQRLDRLTKEIQYLEQGRVPKTYFEKWLTPEQRKHIQFEDRDEWLSGGRYLGAVTGGASSVDKHYYKTLLQSSLGAALEQGRAMERGKENAEVGTSSPSVIGVKRERLEEGEVDSNDAAGHTAGDDRNSIHRGDPVGNEKQRKKLEKTETVHVGDEVSGIDVPVEEEVEENEGNEEVVRSVFQEMKKEEESREFNNRLHLTALSPEAIYLAHHPPKELPPNVPPSLQSLWSLDPMTRHHYFAYFIQKTISEKAMHCFQIMARISNFLTIRNHAVEMARLSLLQSADVVGLTTTGCAMHQGLLRSLRPRVLVVEEAAEVLESQLLACMTDSLQQIILIGDHFQLQPKVETFAYEKINRMNLSLFERLAGHIPVIRLTEQRRMHPALSQLIRPYYSEQELLDHSSLLTRPLLNVACHPCINYVPGLAKRVFFWKHQYPEEKAPGGSRSKVNTQEVQMVYQTVSHMVEQGLMQRSITVITPYLGQRRLLRRHLRLSQLGDVRVSTVDLFQGDESDVIVLSLVRTGHLTEFLQTRNRLVVSCSRARFGMVIIGNDDLLKKCDHWATLLQQLHDLGCVGEALPVTVQTGGVGRSEDGHSVSEFLAPTIRREVRYLLPKHPNQKD